MNLVIRALCMHFLVFVVLALSASASYGAVIIDSQGKELSVWLISESPEKLVVDEVAKSGTLRRREIKRSEITSIFYAVSQERLEQLDPSNPVGYKQYAEELAEIELDPEARPISLRLYHIAAYLAPEELAESCLLAMIRIANDPQHRKRLQFAAYLYGKQPNKQSFVSGKYAPGDAKSVEPSEDLRLLRNWRARRKTTVSGDDLLDFRRLLPSYAENKTDDQLVEVLSSKCADCQAGFNKCTQCSGKGTVRKGTRNISCSHCVRGKSPCDSCGTFYRSKPLPDDLFQHMASAEIVILRSQSAIADRANNDLQTNTDAHWSQSLIASRPYVPAPFTLLTLTDHDPNMCIYRNGTWTKRH